MAIIKDFVRTEKVKTGLGASDDAGIYHGEAHRRTDIKHLIFDTMAVKVKFGGADNFYDYFPAAAQHRRWGICATSFGRVHVPPGSSYPPSPHPRNHFLSWTRGRILRQYQMLYIAAGEGYFESELTPCVKVREGSLLLLFPGIWHRYRPHPKKGWTEYWIELEGRQIEELNEAGVINPKKPIHAVGIAPEILNAFTVARQLSAVKAAGFQVRVGMIGLQILTYMTWSIPSLPGSSSNRMERIMQEALVLLGSNLDQSISPVHIARQLHVGYSYFRRIFKAQTGFSPKQYRLEIRFRRVCDFLLHTDLTIKEIAGQLHYDSPFHLSVDFKNRTAVSPRHWRDHSPSYGFGASTTMRKPKKWSPP